MAAAAADEGATPNETRTLELAIARLLNIGAIASVLLLAIGAAIVAASGRSPLAGGIPGLDIARVPSDLVALRPEGFLWLGLLFVLLTPSSRVIASLIGFAGAGERRMALVSFAILVVIATGVAVSIAEQ